MLNEKQLVFQRLKNLNFLEMEGKIRAEQLHNELKGKSIPEKIEFLVANYPNKVVFTTSF